MDYKSKFEWEFCSSIPKNVKFSYETICLKWQQKIVNYIGKFIGFERVYVKQYTPDVSFECSDVILELKGYLRPDAKKHLQTVAKMFPDKDIRIVFMQDNKIGKKLTYTGWAEKHGFKSCVARTWQELPKEWIKDIKNGARE